MNVKELKEVLARYEDTSEVYIQTHVIHDAFTASQLALIYDFSFPGEQTKVMLVPENLIPEEVL